MLDRFSFSKLKIQILLHSYDVVMIQDVSHLHYWFILTRVNVRFPARSPGLCGYWIDPELVKSVAHVLVWIKKAWLVPVTWGVFLLCDVNVIQCCTSVFLWCHCQWDKVPLTSATWGRSGEPAKHRGVRGQSRRHNHIHNTSKVWNNSNLLMFSSRLHKYGKTIL